MTCFLFTSIFDHFRPWEAVCEHLHTCAISMVQTRASGMVWSLSYDLFSVYPYFGSISGSGRLFVSISTLVRFQWSKRELLGWSGARVMTCFVSGQRRKNGGSYPLEGKSKENQNPHGGSNEGKSRGGGGGGTPPPPKGVGIVTRPKSDNCS